MSSPLPLAEFLGVEWLFWWQLPLVLLLVALVVFWRIYRNRQM